TATAPGSLAKSTPTRRRVLVTGAAGNIGKYFAEHSHERYELRIMVHELDQRADALRPFGEVVAGELSDLAKLKNSAEVSIPSYTWPATLIPARPGRACWKAI